MNQPESPNALCRLYDKFTRNDSNDDFCENISNEIIHNTIYIDDNKYHIKNIIKDTMHPTSEYYELSKFMYILSERVFVVHTSNKYFMIDDIHINNRDILWDQINIDNLIFYDVYI